MDIEENNVNIYEVSYHFAPGLADDALSAETSKIKGLIADLNGELISEGVPELKVLAYPISKTVKAVKNTYSKAYFGWVKFALSPELVDKVKSYFDASDTVLRYLIVTTVRENTLMADREKHASTRPEPAEERAMEEPSHPASENATAEIDKAIDDIVNS